MVFTKINFSTFFNGSRRPCGCIKCYYKSAYEKECYTRWDYINPELNRFFHTFKDPERDPHNETASQLMHIFQTYFNNQFILNEEFIPDNEILRDLNQITEMIQCTPVDSEERARIYLRLVLRAKNIKGERLVFTSQHNKVITLTDAELQMIKIKSKLCPRNISENFTKYKNRVFNDYAGSLFYFSPFSRLLTSDVKDNLCESENFSNKNDAYVYRLITFL